MEVRTTVELPDLAFEAIKQSGSFYLAQRDVSAWLRAVADACDAANANKDIGAVVRMCAKALSEVKEQPS